MIFDKEYTGSRWTYGLRNRPPGIGCVPRGSIIGADRLDPRFNFGTIQYPRQLTQEEIDDYELVPLSGKGKIIFQWKRYTPAKAADSAHRYGLSPREIAERLVKAYTPGYDIDVDLMVQEIENEEDHNA